MLRSARSDDADAIATVLIKSRLAFLPFAPSAHSEPDVRGWTASRLLPSGRVVIWEEDGQIVGVLATSDPKEKSWIEQLYVLPGWTGKGIGSELLAFAHHSLPRPIRLYTFQENAGARRFYERKGYKPIEFTDGRDNEEKCPDVLYELADSGPDAAAMSEDNGDPSSACHLLPDPSLTGAAPMRDSCLSSAIDDAPDTLIR